MDILISDNVYLDKDLTFFTVSGDPGCDGYNVESVAVLEAILKQPADMHLVIGDVVPTGREHWFRQFESLIRRAARAPVFCLPGNHDRPDYSRHLGLANYHIRARNALIVCLDNSHWGFTDEAVAFLRETLAAFAPSVPHIFVAFHFPPPNQFSPNSTPAEKWGKVRDLLLPHKEKVKGIFAGHVHSAFSFSKDGFPVFVTGGGGAGLDPVANTFFETNRHHMLQARLADGQWSFAAEAVLPGQNDPYADDAQATSIRAGLEESFSGECQAQQRYALFARRADLLNQPGLAKLFRAAADSELRHAEAMLFALGGISGNLENLADSIRREEREWKIDYLRRLKEAGASTASGQAELAYDCAIKAEKIHHALFEAALSALEKGEAFPVKRYFTCTRCGFTHEGDAPPSICPACGTDHKRFAEVE